MEKSEARAARPRSPRSGSAQRVAAGLVLVSLSCSAGAGRPTPTAGNAAPRETGSRRSGASGSSEASGPSETSRTPAASADGASGYELPVRTGGPNAAFPFQPPAPVVADTRLARLSHRQYEQTVRDLLGLREPLDSAFAPDASNGFGFDTSTAFRVDPRLGPQYRASAEALAARVSGDATLAARLMPCEEKTPVCRDRFLASFGERAFRRPLARDDLDSFRAVFDAGPARYRGADAFRDGVRATLEVMLQAPDFLYRTEQSRAVDSMGRVQLDDFEVASRLSYFLYDSMPDEPLFAAARAGRLRTPDQVEAAVRRMLTEPRVLDKLVAFHEQAWELERLARISPDAVTYPEAPKGLVQRVRRATRLFVRDVLRSGGGLEELLTAPYAYADDGLRTLYGVPAVAPPNTARPASDAGGRFARIDFDAGERKGLLMQVGYLAANAYSINTDPIHRGLFVVRNLLCREVPDPPPGATTTPPPETDQPIVTTRDEVELVTGQSFCPTCHVEINAPGYAFEGFDAVGRRRRTEKGVAVDTSGSMVLDGQRVSFADAPELVEQLARSKDAHRCYSRRWLEFAYGRALAQSDLATLDAIAADSLPIADIIVAIVRSPQFLSLAPSPPAPGDPGAGVQTPPASAPGQAQ